MYYSVQPNLMMNGNILFCDGKYIDLHQTARILNQHEKNRVLLIEGLKLIRYGNTKSKLDWLKEKQKWLQENWPETYEFDTVDPNNNFTEGLNISTDMWIASELLNILQEEE